MITRISFILLLALVLAGCVSNTVRPEGEIGGPFKSYDTSFRGTIMQRWYALLDKQKTTKPRFGEVELQFHLHDDGSISDMKVIGDSVGGDESSICQQAVASSAPFPHWPEDMSRMVGTNYRIINYTFHYYK
jgi:hypothetical protein